MAATTLEGAKVLEYANFVAAPYCAKLLADLGAEVIKIEPPRRGDESRGRGPYPDKEANPEASGLFLYLNTNKLGITLNLQSDSGRRIFKQLIRQADVLVEDNHPELMQKLGLAHSQLQKINRSLVTTSITPFGQNGPYRDYKAYYLNSYHSALLGYMTPEVSSEDDLNLEPLKIGGFAGEYAVGVSAALATLAATYHQWFTGKGQHIDISKQEALLNFFGIDAARFANWKQHYSRLRKVRGLGGMVACKDGYVNITFNEAHQWSALVRLMGNPEWASQERYLDSAERATDDEMIMRKLAEWALGHTKDELYHRGQAEGLAVSPVWSPQEVLESSQARARDFFIQVEHPCSDKQNYPSLPFKLSEASSMTVRPAPLLGQHNTEIYCQRLGYNTQELTEMAQAGII